MSKRRNYPSSHNPEARLAAIEERGEFIRRRRVGLTGGLAAIVVVLVGLGSLQLLNTNGSDDTMVVAAPDAMNGDTPAAAEDEADDSSITGEQTPGVFPPGLLVDFNAPAESRTLPVTLNTPDLGTGADMQHCVQLDVYTTDTTAGDDTSAALSHGYVTMACRSLDDSNTAAGTGFAHDELAVRPSLGVELGCAISIERDSNGSVPTTTVVGDPGDVDVESNSSAEPAASANDTLTTFEFDLSALEPGDYHVRVSAGAGMIDSCPLPVSGSATNAQQFFDTEGAISVS